MSEINVGWRTVNHKCSNDSDVDGLDRVRIANVFIYCTWRVRFVCAVIIIIIVNLMLAIKISLFNLFLFASSYFAVYCL